MNKLWDDYNRNIDSIGTEYSDTSDSSMYNSNSKSKSKSKPKSGPIYGGGSTRGKKNITVKSQNGGKNLQLIIGGADPDADTDATTNTEKHVLSSTEITELLMKAIDSGKNEAADFILEQKFIPDMTYVNEKKENLIHALVDARDRLKNADKALYQLIKDGQNAIALNMPDINGVTPFVDAIKKGVINEDDTPAVKAIKKGYMKLAEFMEKVGAQRIAPDDLEIMTDRSEQPAEDWIDKAKEWANKEGIYNTNPSSTPLIFTKPTNIRKQLQDITAQDFSQNDAFNDIKKIVEDFGSTTESAISDMSTILPTEEDIKQFGRDSMENLRDKMDRLRDVLPIDKDIESIHKNISAEIDSKINQLRDMIPTENDIRKFHQTTTQELNDKIDQLHNIIPNKEDIENFRRKISSELNAKIKTLHDAMMPYEKSIEDFRENTTHELDKKMETLRKFLENKVQIENPIEGVNPDQSSAAFVEDLVDKLKNKTASTLTGGTKVTKNTKNTKNTKTTKPRKHKDVLNKMVGKRSMVGFDDNLDMFGGVSDNEMRDIARATSNQKDKLHEQAVEKILANLSKKDMLTARAIKAVIYEEVKNKHEDFTALDKAAELLSLITKSKIDEILTKQKETVDKIIDYLKQKDKDREANSKTDKPRVMKRPTADSDDDDDSSVESSSDYDSEDSEDSSSSSSSSSTSDSDSPDIVKTGGKGQQTKKTKKTKRTKRTKRKN